MPYDLDRIWPWCLWLTWAYIVASLVVAGYSWLEIGVYEDLSRGLIDGSSAESALDFYGLAGPVLLALGIAGMAAFVVNAMWIYRASTNAAAIMPDTNRISPGWSVGWFIVPIANLWMPFRAIKQIWISSMNPTAHLGDAAPGFFYVWWIAWVITDIISNISFRYSMRDGLDNYIQSLWLDLASTPSAVLSAFLFLQIMRRVTEAQRDHGLLAETFA